MNLLRFTSRCLLGSYFVANGLSAALNPKPLVEQAQPWADKLNQCRERYLPESVGRRLPASTEGLVRAHGIVQAVAALMMTTGVLRRFGAVLLACAYAPKVWTARPARLAESQGFLKELALLGGALVATGPTSRHVVKVVRSPKTLQAPKTPRKPAA